MNEEIMKTIAGELKISLEQVKNTLALLEEDNTVPFIARYRKEATKGLDEEQILFIQKQYDYQKKLAERKENVLKLIEEQGKLTDEIRKAVNECTKLSQVEDIYRPYAQKKKTRAATAIKNGLQPLADWMLLLPTEGSLEEAAARFVNENVPEVKDAIQGAKDIIAEVVSDNAKQLIINEGVDPDFGARPMKRFIQRNIETKIAEAIIRDAIEDNATITVDAEDGKFTVTTKIDEE